MTRRSRPAAPSPGDRAREVFGERAEYYRTSTSHTDPASLARLVALARPQPTWLALDLASGAGHAALALAPHVRRVIALDLTPEMLAQARRLREARDAENIELCVGDVADLPGPPGAFDLVVCRRAAHHFADLPRALREIHRVLRPGGRLVIDDKSVPPDPRVDAWMNRLDRLHDPSHVREYPVSEWRALLSTSGFERIDAEDYQRLRPPDALTAGVAEEDARRIREAVASMPDDLAHAFGRQERDEGWHILHWYVILSADRASLNG